MEKFTVDLDKVLDEFEFNEEQAIRHALHHFKREDLPATKYQKPHFKPINIADADFGPCIETTMTYPTFHPEPIDPLPEPESEPEPEPLPNPASLSCKVNNFKYPGLADLIEPPSYNHNEKDDSQSEEKSVVLDEVDVSQSVEETEEITIENDTSISDSVEEVKEEVEEVKVEEAEIPKVEEAIALEETEDEVEDAEADEEAEDAVEESQNVQEPQAKPDLIENELINSNVRDEVMGGTKLPDLTEVSQEKSNENKSDTVESLDLIRNDKEVVEDDKKSESQAASETSPEPEPESESELELKETEVEEKEIEVEGEEEEVKEESKSEVVPKPQEEEIVDTVPPTETTKEASAKSDDRIPVEEPVIEKTEIKPIQFESQLDITDEELQKYLEELEEEEEEEKRRNGEADSKPSRPDSLTLDKSKQSGSPGSTPLPRNNAEGEAGVDNENKVEGKEESGVEDKENMCSVDEVEALLESSLNSESSEPPLTVSERRLGKVSPFWMPDHLANSCMECDSKFTVIKRRHHCRACGRILCSKCCGMRASLEYLQNQEQRVCETCFRTLAKVMMYELQNESENESSPRRRPNPNNPMEYCSTVPPPLQVSSSSTQPPPSVLVPVGVLKREGSSKVKETPKQVMFSDGIRPGGDLTELDGSGDHRNTYRKPGRSSKRAGTPPGNASPSVMLPPVDPASQSFILEKGIPPICIVNKGETTYEENWPLPKILEKLKDPKSPPLQFAINRNLSASVKIVKLDCCIKETCWVMCSKGMGCVGQDEIVILLTLKSEDDDQIPKEVFLQFHYIYKEAARGNTVNELGYWCVKESTFLDSKQHGGFLFIRPTFQCLSRIEIPPPPFLVGILIHRSEIPWARVFPFRLMLRLGAEFRYYPCPLVSVRFREPVYYEIGHTIINLLADFRNLSYTIPSVRGLRIHMEANQTSILIPKNRYDQVIRALNNSNDPVLALAGNFSPEADAHLVCIQSKGNEVTYSTQAIHINDKPRKVTGASFVVLNGALKTTSGVAAKSSIVEDGLMVQVPSDTMTALRTKLRNMEDWSVKCGPIEGRNSEEVVKIIWCEDDKNFNVGVKSVIDNMPLDGVPSIRVHSGKDYNGCTKFIRWTQVFIIKCEDGATSAKIGDPLEVNKLSESIARATCIALSKLLELLAASGLTVLAVRATIDQDNVGYEAGSNGEKLAPIYMNSLDNELIPVLHKAASLNDSVAVLELIFHIMDQ